MTGAETRVSVSVRTLAFRLISLIDRLVPKSRSILYRSFPDVCDQGIQTVGALVEADLAPVTWLVDDVGNPPNAGSYPVAVSTTSDRAPVTANVALTSGPTSVSAVSRLPLMTPPVRR